VAPKRIPTPSFKFHGLLWFAAHKTSEIVILVAGSRRNKHGRATYC
jgi:hypothetical protein